MSEPEQNLLNRIAQTSKIVVYFSFPECQVCQVLKPKIQELLTNYPHIDFLYVDIEKYPLFRGQYLVLTVPTIVHFEGGREMRRFSRHISVQEVKQYLDRRQQLENRPDSL